MSGLEMCRRRGHWPKLLTLTSSPSSPLDISHSFDTFLKRLRRFDSSVQYAKVPELTESGLKHLHVLIDSVRYLPQAMLSNWWSEIHGAFVVDIRRARADSRGQASYLVKYLSKQGFRYSYSRGWCFPSFVKVWTYLRQTYGFSHVEALSASADGHRRSLQVILNLWYRCLRFYASNGSLSGCSVLPDWLLPKTLVSPLR